MGLVTPLRPLQRDESQNLTAGRLALLFSLRRADRVTSGMQNLLGTPKASKVYHLHTDCASAWISTTGLRLAGIGAKNSPFRGAFSVSILSATLRRLSTILVEIEEQTSEGRSLQSI